MNGNHAPQIKSSSTIMRKSLKRTAFIGGERKYFPAKVQGSFPFSSFALLDLAAWLALRFGHESAVCASCPGFAGVVPVSLSVTGAAGLSARRRVDLRSARRKRGLAPGTGQRPVVRLPAGFR